MRILFIVPYTPTPIRTRPYNLLRGLARRGHEVTLATLWQNAGERDALREWQSLGVSVIAEPLTLARSLLNVARALPGADPLQASFCWQPALARRIAAELADAAYDVVHVEHLRGARYALAAKEQAAGRTEQGAGSRKQGTGARVVWDSVDCISYLFAQAANRSASAAGRVMTRVDLRRTQRYEGWLLGQFDRVLVTSSVDRDALESLGQHGLRTAEHAGDDNSLPDGAAPADHGIAVITNGVDLDYFTPEAVARQDETLVFSGKMSYHANVTMMHYFCREVLPLVWARRPGVRLCIVGHEPPRSIRELSSDPRITVTGSVPDIRPHLRAATIAVVPLLYGAGVQFKVLEAMACGTPAVVTRRAALPLAARDGEHLLVAEGAADLAAAVLRLLDDAELRARLGRAGRQFVEQNHDWTDIVARLEGIYHDVIAPTDVTALTKDRP